jgi:hypothetical protein
MNGNGWNTFMRMAGLYGQPEQVAGVQPRIDETVETGPDWESVRPDQRVTARPELPPWQKAKPDETIFARPGYDTAETIPPQVTPTADWQRMFQPEPDYENMVPDEIVQAQTEQPESTLEAFRRNVLNPPRRTSMTYPKNTLAGLQKGLEILATPTDYEKNRVFVNNQAYQKAQVYTDPKTGERKFITPYKQPTFMENVLKAMPAAASPAVDILNQRYADQVADWEMRNKAFKEAAGAESAMALAQQRQAQAGAVPVTAGAKLMDAQTRARLAQLKDLPDSEKIRLLQEGKVSLEELRASNQLTLEGARQTGRVELEGVRQTGREKLEGVKQLGRERIEDIKQSGRLSLEDIKSANDKELEELKQSGRLSIEGVRQVNREQQTRQRGEEARKTKAAPSGAAGATGQLPTQQKVAMQEKVSRIINDNPEWEDLIEINEHGFPQISTDADPDTYEEIHQALYGGGVTVPTPTPPAANPPPFTPTAPTAPNIAPTTRPTPSPQNVPIPPPLAGGPKPIVQHSESTGKYRISYDGGKSWRDYNPFGKQ